MRIQVHESLACCLALRLAMTSVFAAAPGIILERRSIELLTRGSVERRTWSPIEMLRPLWSSPMSDETKRAGLGKVIYSVDETKSEENEAEERAERVDVDEADKESFPASDPPGFAGGTNAEST